MNAPSDSTDSAIIQDDPGYALRVALQALKARGPHPDAVQVVSAALDASDTSHRVYEPEIWPYVNQLEELMATININLVWYLEDRMAQKPEAGAYFNTAHHLLGAAQTIVAALAVKVGVRNELSRNLP